MIDRRKFLEVAIAGAGLAGLAPRALRAEKADEQMIQRAIPKTGEKLPVVGMGTWQTFDAGAEEAARAPLREVLEAYLAAGGRVIDSSPMYGRAEEVAGDLLASVARGKDAFVATKVWTSGQKEGERQMKRSLARLRRQKLDLMQVHNLLDWKTHLGTLRGWKKEGVVRYIGVTHYQLGAFGELESIIKNEGIDFVQLPYNIANREAERRLLPAAAANKVAVLVMRPFEEGSLFGRVRGKELPGVAREIGAATWAQFFLKFIIGHPAVTCPIPATSKVKHLRDNVQAGTGPIPTEAQRKKMVEAFDAV
jgi:aryl-alcohol dehydrogenase-like predicted oxidoreductase